MINPKEGEIWIWLCPDEDRVYGPGIVLGQEPGARWNTDVPWVTFHFGDRGVLNVPVPMVQRYMRPKES